MYGAALQEVLADWRRGQSKQGVPNSIGTSIGAEWQHDQWPEQTIEEGSTQFNAWSSCRLSSEELDKERGQELRSWKEHRVDEAVALIRVRHSVTNVDVF